MSRRSKSTAKEISLFWSCLPRRPGLRTNGLGSRTSSRTPIGPIDTLIAGQTLARDLTLVTRNTREFLRVDGLRVENWEA